MLKRKKRRDLLAFVIMLLILFFLLFVYWKEKQDAELAKTPLPVKINDVVASKKDEIIELSSEKGIHVVITEDFRSFTDQEALYAQGRTKDGNIVTYAKAGQSYHNYGLAIDFALLNLDGIIIWDMEYDGNGNGESDWLEVVSIAKSLGFEWGGDWREFKDYPHLQMDFGLSIRDLQKGKRP